MIKRLLQNILALLTPPEDPIFGAAPRSSKWKVLKDQLVCEIDECEACGRKDNLTAHHIQPYHLHPELELVKENLIVLCNGGSSGCHFIFGHLKNWQKINPHVREDAKLYRKRIENS